MFVARLSSVRLSVRSVLVAALSLVMGAATLPMLAAPASAVAASPGPGYVDFQYGVVGASGPEEVTSYHSQSKLWFNDGIWWSVMFDDANPSGAFEIYRLNMVTQEWTTTGVKVEDRQKSHLDVVWDGGKLYVAASNDGVDKPIRVFTFNYNATTDTYSPVFGPDGVAVSAAVGVRFATITRASGALWLGYTLDNAVWTMSSTDDGATWSSPVSIALADPTHAPIAGGNGSTAESDDVAVVTPIPSGVGIMWSKTSVSSGDYGGFFFATNTGSGWSQGVPVWEGPSVGDNHISMKTASDGRVIVAVKTSFNSGANALIAVLERSTGGTWANPDTPGRSLNVSTGDQAGTRPMLVLDEGAGQANVFITKPVGGGKIYRRTAPLGTLNFGTPQLGSDFISASTYAVNDATSTKQPVNSTAVTGTGLVVLATAKAKLTYLHNCVGGPCPVKPVADFTSTVDSLSVSFTDASANGPTSWLWDFGDGTTSTEQNPSHTYSTAGTKTVKLTATNVAGSHQVTKTVTVTNPPVAPTASFSMDKTSGTAPLTVSFTDKSTESPTSWSWSFGDGATSTLQNPSHTYTTAGSYTVTLTATNGVGPSAPVSQTVTVAAAPTAPTAAFTATPTSGTAPLAVKFTDSSTGSPTSWSWSFGDGGTSTLQNPSHTYSAAGTYTVTLTATNGVGPSSPVSKTVTVSPPPGPAAPVASFTAEPAEGRTPLDVQFTDTSTGSPTSRTWDFGDGTSSTEANPLHTYTASGTYTATLTVGNAGGSSTATKTITVIPGGARFTPVTPTRVLTGKAMGPRQFATLALKPPSGTSSVALNVTVTKATKSSTVAVCTGDDVAADCVAQPVLQVRKGHQAAGFTIVKLGPGQTVKLYNSAGTATVSAYVQGWFVGKTTESYFVAQGNRRVLSAKQVGPNQAFKLQIPAGLRPSGTTAVSLNVSATGATAGTSVAVCASTVGKKACKARPTLYVSRGGNATNHVVTRLGAGGTVKLVNTSGSVRLTVDVQGAFTTTGSAATFRPNPLRRVTDSRPMTAKSTYVMTMRQLPAGTSSVALRVTVTGATANSWVSVCRGDLTTASCKKATTLPVQKGRTAVDVVVVPVGPGGTVKFYNSAGTNKLSVDVFGSFGRT